MVHYCHHVHMLEIDTRCISWKGKAEQERTEKGQKRKALMEELTLAKRAKEDLEKVSKKLVNTADKKAK